MSGITIQVSASAGFCWGVERALEAARNAACGADGPVYTLGPLIHNPGVIAELQQQGIGVANAPEEVSAGTIILRSHGVSREVKEQLVQSGLTVVDATCRYVKLAQEKAADLRARGYLVVILGEKEHPEVAGLRSYAGPDSLVVETPEDLPAQLRNQRVGVVVQTTQSQDRLASLAARLAPLTRELLIYNTICRATDERQQAAVAMANEVEVVIVVGGKDSGNTRRLAELCSAVQPRTYHVERPDEIRPEWLNAVRSVGITAGASTPPEQIEAVVKRIRELDP